MIGFLIAVSALAAIDDPPRPPVDQPAARSSLSPVEAEALARYNGMMAKPPRDAAEHWKMATWCEQNDLRPEAYFHFGKVIELDPKRDAAWQKLGFKKVASRWMTAEQIADEAKQKLADKEWSAKLKKWHKEIHGGRKQAEARAAIGEVTAPAAVPAVYREFAGGGPVDQDIALDVLGNIEGAVASKVIATLAVYGKTPAVRRHASELLRGRPADEFLDLLVALMRDTLKYEVRPVGGPGSPGILFVEGERFNVQRFYAPPPPPTLNPRPGDTIGYDLNGLPVVIRVEANMVIGKRVGVPGSKTLVTETDRTTKTTEMFSFENAMAEAQRAAMSAQAQLEADIARIEAINDGLHRFNDLIMSVARTATGKDPGQKAKDWRDLLQKRRGERYASRPAPKPTFGEMVPLDYVPDLAATMTLNVQTRFITQTIVDS